MSRHCLSMFQSVCSIFWSADVFVSIHANASHSSAARGIETYFLNFAPNPQAEAIAARENAASARSMRLSSATVTAVP